METVRDWEGSLCEICTCYVVGGSRSHIGRCMQTLGEVSLRAGAFQLCFMSYSDVYFGSVSRSSHYTYPVNPSFSFSLL